MRVLISGAGIAGPTLAYWLARHGHEPTIVETAPRLRTGGYIIDFWGLGYDVAERMGLIAELQDKAYRVRELKLVGRDGHRVGGFDISSLDSITNGRLMSLPRSELAAAIHRSLVGVETRFGDAIESIADTGHDARVRFASGDAATFDLVIGADGLHSRVRELVFGPQAEFEHYLGYKVAAAQLAGYPHRDEGVYMLFSGRGIQVGRFTMRGGRTLLLFIWADDDAGLPSGHEAQRAELKARFGGQGWECDEMLAALDASDELYFDRVSQIRMPAWTKGRVALVGDAASCVSLVAGQGSALAMATAYVLAGELKVAAGDHIAAFAAYEQRCMPFLAAKQRAAARFAGSFVPKTEFRAFVRNQMTKLLRIPFVGRLAFRGMHDRMALPAYEATAGVAAAAAPDRTAPAL